MLYSKTLQNQTEQFYKQFWSSASWGNERPNIDESLRAIAIRYYAKRAARKMPPTDVLKIIDIGCGRGWLSKALSDFGRVVGIDPVNEAIERARTLFPGQEFHCGFAEDMMPVLGRESFNLAVSSEVIEHVPAPLKPAFIRNIYDFLIPGGYAILTTPRGALFDYCMTVNSNPQPVEDWLTERDLHIASRNAGFQIVDSRRIWVPGYGYSKMARIVSRDSWSQVLHNCGLKRIQDFWGVYQIILLQRPHSKTA